MGLAGDVGFTHAIARGRLFHPGPLRSFARALGVVGFIPGRWVHSREHWRSLGSSGVIAFTCVRRLGQRVLPVSLRSFGCALGVNEFIRRIFFLLRLLWV